MGGDWQHFSGRIFGIVFARILEAFIFTWSSLFVIKIANQKLRSAILILLAVVPSVGSYLI